MDNGTNKTDEECLHDTHEEWLQETGLGEQETAAFLKRLIAAQLRERMREKGFDAHRLSEHMQTSYAAVERLLDPENDMVPLRTLYRAGRALELRLRIELA